MPLFPPIRQRSLSHGILKGMAACGLALLLTAASVKADEMILAEKGHALATIVAPGTDEVEKFAAKELARYLSRMANCDFKAASEAKAAPRTISAGTLQSLKPLLEASKIDAAARLANPESFLIAVQPDRVFIVGATPRALLYAVYDLLEDDLGARWTIPGPQGEFIPVRDPLSLAVGERVEAPSFPIRCFELMKDETKEGRQTVEIIDWIAKRKMNICTVAWCYVDWTQYEKYLRPEIIKRGLIGGGTNHGMFLPPDKYSATHPEYYALRDGVRKWDKSPLVCHLCYTNPEAATAVAGELDAIVKRNPELTQIGMLPADGWKVCQCPSCAKLVEGECGEFWAGQHVTNATSLILNYANNVSRAFKAKHPETSFWFEAYSPTILPPKAVAPDPDMNVSIYIYWRCAIHPLSSPDCQRCREYADVLRGWRKAAKGKIMISDYLNGLAQPIPWWPVMTIMKPDYEFLQSIGIDGVKMWGLNGPRFKMAETGAYLNAELLWDLKQDEWKAIGRFCEGRYRSAGNAMLQYYREVALEMDQAAKESPSANVPNTWPMPATHIKNPEKLRALIEQARKEAKEPAAQAAVNDAWIQNEYSILLAEVGKADLLCKKAISSTGNNEERKAAFTAFEKAVDAFSAFFKEHLKSGMYYGTTKRLQEMVATYWKSGEVAQQDLPGPVRP